MGDIVIGGTLHSAATGNIVARANEIFDSDKNKKQSVINHDVDESISNLDGRINTLESAIGEGGNIDERINQAKSELIDSADNDYNTLGKTETKIKEESNNRQTSINSAKSEIIGDASSDYNTLGKTELRIKEEKSRATDAENALNSSKANKATTLLGYGISDAYTKHEVNELVSTPHQNYVTVATKAELDAIVDPSTDTIYRVSSYDFTANDGVGAVDVTKYSEYAYNGSAMIPLTVKSQTNEIFDISKYHSGAIYANLTEALGVNGANIPATIRQPGMSIKFIKEIIPASYTVVKTEGLESQPTGTELSVDPNVESGTYNSSQLGGFSELPVSTGAGNAITYWMEIAGDTTTYTSWVLTMAQSSYNKYVQWRYMETVTTSATFTNVANWQGVDDEPTAGSDNLVKSGGVAKSIDGIVQHEFLEEVPNEILITDDEDNEVLNVSPNGVDAKNLKSNGVDVITSNDFTENDRSKLELIDIEETIQEIDEVIVTDDDDEEILNVSPNGVDAKNLKTNGKDVLVEQSVTHISVASDGTKDFTSIQEALNSITDASKNNRYQIDVYTDEIITQRSQLWDHGNYENITQRVGNRDVYGFGFMTKDYVDIVGIGNVTVGVVLSRSEIEGYKGANIVPVHMRKNTTLKNLHIVSQNTRYTIHTEVGTSGDNVNVTQIIEDCIIDYLGNPDAAYFSDQWSSGCPWGCGLLSGQTCILRGCIIKGDSQCVCHTNSNFANPASVIFEKCEWMYYGGGINFNEYGSNVHNNVRFIDCIMPPFFRANPSIRNNIVNAWTNIWNIEIRRCTPCAIDINNWSNTNFLNNTEVHVMKFVTADEGSTIKVVGGTAKDLIYGENYVLSRKTTTNGYCAGTLLIGDNKNSQESYKFALGNRLGDCSVTNKTLIVEVTDSNGNTSQHTITFSNNYGGDSSVAPLISQSAILSEINSQLTDIAVCSVNIPQNFPYGDKYYLVRNKGSEKILAGMGVVFDYTLGVSSVRVATSEDGHIDGIALEDIPVYASYDKNMYKVIKKGDYLYRYQSGSPKIYDKWESILGVMYKIGSTDDGYFVHTNNINEACLIGISEYLFKLI